MEILRSVISSEVRMDDVEGRQREFVISTQRKDSHQTIIPLAKWDVTDFNKSGAFYYNHLTTGGFLSDPNPDNALGPATAKMYDDHLAGIGEFEPAEINPLAEKLMKKVDFGTMKTTSVGFLPTSKGHWGEERNGEDPEAYYFGDVRLVEWSIVHIPSNPDAVKKSLESMSKFMHNIAVEEHPSRGFRRDYKHFLLKSKLLI